MEKVDFTEFYMTIRKKLKEINLNFNKKLAELGLSSQHAVYLISLSNHENVKVKELNDIVGNDGAITTRVLQTLFKRGLVEKSESSIRKCHLYLSNKGKEINTAIKKGFEELKTKLFPDLTTEEVVTLCRIFKKMSTN